MNEQSTNSSAPMWFLIVSIILLLWNLMGLFVFGVAVSLPGNDEMMQKFELNEAQINLINETPAWVNVAFGVAVTFGVLGCIALLMRKKFAVPLFVLSLLGVIAQNVYVFFMSNSVEVMGVGLAPIVIAVAIALIPFSMFAAKQGWLR